MKLYVNLITCVVPYLRFSLSLREFGWFVKPKPGSAEPLQLNHLKQCIIIPEPSNYNGCQVFMSTIIIAAIFSHSYCNGANCNLWSPNIEHLFNEWSSAGSLFRKGLGSLR